MKKNAYAFFFICAEGGNRTHTSLRSRDFKSLAYNQFRHLGNAGTIPHTGGPSGIGHE